MKLKYSFEMVNVDEEIVFVPVGHDAEIYHGVLKLNNEGFEIMELLKEDISENKIIEHLSSKYQNDSKELEGLVRTFINKLRADNLITE